MNILQQKLHDSIMRLFAKHVDMEDTKDMCSLHSDIEEEATSVVKHIINILEGN